MVRQVGHHNQRRKNYRSDIHQSQNTGIQINNKEIKKDNKAKYLGIFIDQKLNWGDHIREKCIAVKRRFGQLYWLLGRNSTLSTDKKLLIYKTIIAPIWMYGIELWGTTSKTNILKIQRIQSKILRTIVDAPWYITNEDLHKELEVDFVTDVIRQKSVIHASRLLQHDNKEIKNMPIEESKYKMRLKRKFPTDLMNRS